MISTFVACCPKKFKMPACRVKPARGSPAASNKGEWTICFARTIWRELKFCDFNYFDVDFDKKKFLLLSVLIYSTIFISLSPHYLFHFLF